MPVSCRPRLIDRRRQSPFSQQPTISRSSRAVISRSAFLTAWLLRLSSRATDGWWQAWYRHATCDRDIAVWQASYDISAEQERVCAVASRLVPVAALVQQ